MVPISTITWRLSLLVSLFLSPNLMTQAQTTDSQVPPIIMVRAEESYAFLKHNDSTQLFLRALKLIPLNQSQSMYLTVGGEFRPRVEHFTNENYTSADRTDYSQRLSVHANVVLGKRLRLFGELYHGYTGSVVGFFQEDPIDIHQAFMEGMIVHKPHHQLKLRIGRQEMGLGSNRLVGIREGTNMRRTFDLGRLILTRKQARIDILYGKEVGISPSAFDNVSNVFTTTGSNPALWGVYSEWSLNEIAKVDLYYLGFHSPGATYANAMGEEVRHSLGIRSHGKAPKLTYNTEVIFQFGDIGGDRILAYNVETDWAYKLSPRHWQPTIGLRLDWSSGDAEENDGLLGTFNPIFVNPAIYSLAAVNTPANILSFHPNLTITPAKGVSIYMDYAFFYRTQEADGLYLPPRFLSRVAGGVTQKHIGDVLGIQALYQVNRNVSVSLMSSYFIAGTFLQETGPAENTFFIAPTLNLKL